MTIFRTFFNTISQIPQTNIAIPTSHWYTLKVLSNTFPNMQTKPKSVQNWWPCSDSKSGFKQWFHHYSKIFQHHFPNSAAKYCNTKLPTSHRYTLKVLSNTYPNMPTNIYGNVNGNGFRNGELVEVQNLAASTYFTIFRTFFITFSQNTQPNIATPTCHWYTLIPRLKDFSDNLDKAGIG